MAEDSPSAVKSADRVLDLLELLARGRRGLSHTEISAALKIPKSSLTQLLKTLLARGYVEPAMNGRAYQPGRALLSLTRGIHSSQDLVTLATPVLEAVTRATGESSALNILRDGMAEVVATVIGPARLVTHMRLGDLAPLYATSGGKAILAHMPAACRDDYVDTTELTPATQGTLRSKAELRRQLQMIVATGFAYSHQEWTPGIIGIGVPILDADGLALGAINVAVPAARFDEAVKARCEAALKDAAATLERQLGQGG